MATPLLRKNALQVFAAPERRYLHQQATFCIQFWTATIAYPWHPCSGERSLADLLLEAAGVETVQMSGGDHEYQDHA